MSAIVGVYRWEGGPVSGAELEGLLERLAHRGPDGKGAWNEGPVGLGHQRLCSTPESLREHQPLVGAGGDLVITADARVDNRTELIAELGLTGRPAGEITDSELILASYERWGERCPEKLLGDFAFAIWDRRQGTLFCARDPLGVKPFYYHASGRFFAFGTEIKALLSLPEVPRRLNEVKVGEHLAMVSTDATLTFYEGILRLHPGHTLAVSPDGARQKPYWSLDAGRELRLSSDEEYAAALRELFREVVRCRLRSAFPLGAMLSGGLDSSSIVSTARQLLAEAGPSGGARPLITLSAVFEGVPQSDESEYIRAVLAQDGLEPLFLVADQVGPLTDLDRVLRHQDEAIYAGNLYLNWCLYRSAQQRGVRVVLDGFDGDTTLSHGTGYLHELAQRQRWLTLAREASAYARHFHVSPCATVWWYVRCYGLHPFVTRSRLLNPTYQLWKRLRGQPGGTNGAAPQPAWPTPIRPEFARRIGLAERAVDPRGVAPTEREQHYRMLTRTVIPDSLEVLDRAAAAHGIEMRFPFCDRRLAEFCLALPPEQKLRQGWNRMVMRRAMAGILPEEVRWRGGKADMAPGFEHGMRTYEVGRLREALCQEPSVLEPYLDLPTVRAAFARFLAREGSGRDAMMVWRAASLAFWLQRTALAP